MFTERLLVMLNPLYDQPGILKLLWLLAGEKREDERGEWDLSHFACATVLCCKITWIKPNFIWFWLLG